MFVGSERMDSIFGIHSTDLNKWVNCSLDRIESEADCRALITQPVAGKIEYDPDAVVRIVEHCRGNPFYMNLVASKVVRRCIQERRTFVGASDVEQELRGLVRELGPTNFAHFWEDVPVLDPNEKWRSAAQNCLFLACVSALGSGRYESLDDLVDAQAQMNIKYRDRLPLQELREVEKGLLHRRVISRVKRLDPGAAVELPVFRDWLLEVGEDKLLSVWGTFQYDEAVQPAHEEAGPRIIVQTSAFPIEEDELLSVSEKLLYLGKQKDVAEVRRWLRQFDDDSRIEIAFLLLKRLVEEGFVTDGAFVNGIGKMERSVSARHKEIGGGAWKIVRRRLDNLYLVYVDSETKSGAATARELAKRMSPGKCGSARAVPTWVRGHAESDPLVVVVDDFAGTGSTLVKGLERLWNSDGELIPDLAAEGRLICCLQAALPEAVRRVQREFKGVVVLAMKTFDDRVRAFRPEAGIFSIDSDRTYAREVMLQIGQQLVPQHPLGYGDTEALVSFHNTIPNNTLPVFWSMGSANGQPWTPLIPRGSFGS